MKLWKISLKLPFTRDRPKPPRSGNQTSEQPPRFDAWIRAYREKLDLDPARRRSH